MKIQRIEVQNIKHVEFWELRPRTLNVISGANGTGKTSRLDALRAVFAGGTDPEWLRKGCKEGHVIVELDTGATIKKRLWIKRNGEITSELVITDPEGLPVPAPQTFVDQLAGILAVDPVRLLQMPPKKFAEELLKILPIRFLREQIGNCGYLPDTNATDSYSLDDVVAMRKKLYDSRRAANLKAEDANATATQLARSLPPEDDGDPREQLATWRGEADAIRKRVQAGKDEIRESLRLQIEAIRKQADKDVEALREAATASVEEIERITAGDLKAALESVAAIEERAAAYQRAAGAREQVDVFRAKSREAALDASRLDTALEKLDALKSSKLSDLPVAGLTYENGEFLVDGISWPHCNTARRVEIGLQIAAAMEPDLRFLVLDDCEHLDSEGWAALESGAAAMGYQVAATRVTDEPLKVEAR